MSGPELLNDLLPNTSRLFALRRAVRQTNQSRFKEVYAAQQDKATNIEAVDNVRAVGKEKRRWEADPEHKEAPEESEECGGMPAQLLWMRGAPMRLTRNVDSADGLTNGARCYAVCFEEEVDTSKVTYTPCNIDLGPINESMEPFIVQRTCAPKAVYVRFDGEVFHLAYRACFNPL